MDKTIANYIPKVVQRRTRAERANVPNLLLFFLWVVAGYRRPKWKM